MNTSVDSRLAWSSLRRLTIAACTETSSAETGSSATTTSGSPASARAMATRCFWPPDSWWGFRPASSAGSRTTSRRWATSRRVASRERWRSRRRARPIE